LEDEDRYNKLQRKLYGEFEPFFLALHGGLKRLDRVVREHEKGLVVRRGGDREVKLLKQLLGVLQDEVRGAEVYFRYVGWLQERFPGAVYEDVTGLCKLATVEEIAEQDFSLNPGRYVGVVIEEDGKTEEEFIEEMILLKDEFSTFSEQAVNLQKIIMGNITTLVGE
jgi:type I restriction enzyme M protein